MSERVGYDLFNEGGKALARASIAGICVDTEYLSDIKDRTETEIRHIREELEQSRLGREWISRYKGAHNWRSHDQLADVIYNVLGYTPNRYTAGGKPASDIAALEALKIPEVALLSRMQRLSHALSTGIKGVGREVVRHSDDTYRVHPSFNLHIPVSFRSSSTNPNFQNIPKRDKEVSQLIRRTFIPRPGNLLLACDFSKAEICCGYCYHQDPNMRSEILDSKQDMHRDTAKANFKLTDSELGEKGSSTYKELRHHGGKSGFVFPQFYGDYFVKCAAHMWDAISTYNLVTAQGISIKEHLKSKGIHNLERFTEHVRGVEHDFWNRRFKVYNTWKETFYNQYQRRGHFKLLSGFVASGYFRKNQVINIPVQGSAFHWLLKSLIMIDAEISKRGLKSCIIGQIHDEIVFDVHPDERDILIEMCRRVMTEELPSVWRWITIPLSVELEASEINGSWAEMKGID